MDQALDLLDPSGGQQSVDSFPSIHGSPCGSPGPILPLLRTGETVSPTAEPMGSAAGLTPGHRVPLSAISDLPYRRYSPGTPGDHRKGSRLMRSPRSPGSGELSSG